MKNFQGENFSNIKLIVAFACDDNFDRLLFIISFFLDFQVTKNYIDDKPNAHHPIIKIKKQKLLTSAMHRS